MKYPSIKSILKIDWLDKIGNPVSIAKEVRKIMIGYEGKIVACYDNMRVDYIADKYPVTAKWISDCYHMPKYHAIKMAMLNELLQTFGVEYIPKGHNVKSPSIEYLNTGDTYTTTILFVNGRYKIGNWGNYIERGNYE